MVEAISDARTFFLAEIDRHQRVAEATRQIGKAFADFASAVMAALAAGGKVLVFGNGGSAADAQHIAAELVVRYRRRRAALAAIALTTDTSVLTAIANDFGFEGIFARQIEALGRRGDVAIGISTSGTSANVLEGLRTAREQGLLSVGLTGGDGGRLREVADLLLVVPSDVTARIQEMHMLMAHTLCDLVEQSLAS